jgi:hypothetical protein
MGNRRSVLDSCPADGEGFAEVDFLVRH